MVEAVLFDLDDTLFDHRGCAREALAAAQQLDDRLRTMPFDALEGVHAGFLEELHRDVMLGRLPIEVARLERFRRLLTAAGGVPSDALVARLAATYRDTYMRGRRAVGGAAALLAAVSRRARVAVVSNNLLEEQQDKLRICGLDRLIDLLVVSEEAGVSKPDPAIFRITLERLNVNAHAAVMIGDSWSADIAGARATGIRAIWFNPTGAIPPETVEPAVPELKALEPIDAAMRMIFDADRY